MPSQCGEQSAGADRGELCGVADEQRLGAALGGQFHEWRDAFVVGHRGLVEDDHGVRPDPDAALLDAVVELVGAVGAVEASRRPWSRCAVAPATAVPITSLPSSCHARAAAAIVDALARPGGADQDADPAGPGDRLQRLALLLGEGAFDLPADLPPRLLQRVLADGRRVLVRAPLGDLDRGLLVLAELPRRPRPVLQLQQLTGAREVVNEPVRVGGSADAGAQLVGLGVEFGRGDHRCYRAVTFGEQLLGEVDLGLVVQAPVVEELPPSAARFGCAPRRALATPR